MSTIDTIDRLPKRARIKIGDMFAAESDALARLNTTVDRVRALFKSARMKSGEDGIADEEEEISRLQGIQAQQSKRHVDLANCNAKVRRFLMELPAHMMLEDMPRQKVKPHKGESTWDAIKRVRLDVTNAKAEVQKLLRAGPRAADQKRAARAYVNGLAATGRPKVTATHEKFEIAFETGQFTLAPNVRAILAWLDPDALIKRLEDEIDALPVPALALSSKEKNERLAAAQEKLLVHEHEEEALIDLAYDDGEQIIRRPEADPVAILGVQIKRKKAVAA